MSVRVNLLPEATKERGRSNQQRAVAGSLALLLLLVLGGAYWWATSQVRQAEDELATEQAQTASLRGEEAELIAFRDIADRRDIADETLRTALGREVSLAGLLQDVAAVFPEDAQIDTLTLALAPPTDTGEPPSLQVGTISITGQTLSSHAPGVEQLLLSLEKITSFDELYLNSSNVDGEGDDTIATFSVDGRVRAEAATGRYADGLPEGVR